MSKIKEWKDKLYELELVKVGKIKLDKKQIKLLIKEVDKIYVDFVESVAFLYNPKFLNIFLSDEVQDTINTYRNAAKESMKNKSDKMYFVDNYLFSLLEEFNNNRKMVADLLHHVERELNSLLEDLRSYSYNMDILRKLFDITTYIEDIVFLISLTEKYHISNNLSLAFEFVYTMISNCGNHSKFLMDTYIGWATEK